MRINQNPSGMESEILELKMLIEQLRDADPAFEVFGASSHRYQIGPTLSEAEIRALENEHGIDLPEDYRLYLKLVGNGRYCGKAHRTQAAWTVAGAGPYYGVYPASHTVQGDKVSEPFPFEESFELPDDPQYENWGENVPGLLEIANSGCGSFCHLVVKGPKYGTIWESYDYASFCLTSLSFSKWMRNWAEEHLRRLGKKRSFSSR